MSRKKVFLLLISLIMMSLFSNIAFGQQQGLGGVADTIHNLFGFITDVITLDKLVDNNQPAALFWAKFLIWLLLFSVIYFGATFVFTGRNRIATVVALVIAIMGAVTIPNTVIIGIFQTYSLAAGFLVWFVPVAAGLYVAHKIENRMLKAVFYLLLMIILINIDSSLSTAVSKAGGTISIGAYEYFKLLFAVVFIAFIWNLVAAFGVGRQEAAGWLGGIGERIGSSVGDWFRGGRRDRGEPYREPYPGPYEGPIDREEAREEEVEEAERLDERLGEIERELREELRRREFGEIERLGFLARLLRELGEIQEALRARFGRVGRGLWGLFRRGGREPEREPYPGPYGGPIGRGRIR